MATMTKSNPESKSLTRFEYLFNKYVNLEKWMSSEDELEYFIYYERVYETIPSKVNVADFFAIISFDPTLRLNGITEDYITKMLQNKAICLSEQGSKIKVGKTVAIIDITK
jgi:hypothetical protein